MNNCSDLITGIGADTVSASSSSTTCSTDKNKYNGESGVKASTTGNVYGVYDMSGGAYEYVMGNMIDITNQFYTSSAANWSTTTYPLAKYYDSYTYGTSYDDSAAYSRGKLGDATIEMAPSSSYSWYSDYARFPSHSDPCFLRGGYNGNSSDAGLFYFERYSGYNYSLNATRSTLVIN